MRNVNNRIAALSFAGLIALFAAGCRQDKPASASVAAAAPEGVAQVGGGSISAEQFRALLKARSAGDPERFANLDAKEALLDELVLREAAYQKALAAGFDRRPDIQESVKRMITDKFQEEQRGADSASAPRPVAPAQIEEYYQIHAEEFTEPAAVRGAGILIKIPSGADAEHRERLMTKAQAVLDEAKAAPDEFAQLARQDSDDQASRYQGGDTGWISGTRKTIDPELAQALRGLHNAGDFAPLIPARNGVWIARLTDSRSAAVRPLAAVKEVIAYKLTRARDAQREKTLAANLKAGLPISINEDLLKSIHLPTPQPPAAPAMIPSFARAQ